MSQSVCACVRACACACACACVCVCVCVKLGPHYLHVGVVLPPEEVVAAVRPHHVLIHSELDLPPELAVFLGSHGQPEDTTQEGGWAVKTWHPRG